MPEPVEKVLKSAEAMQSLLNQVQPQQLQLQSGWRPASVVLIVQPERSGSGLWFIRRSDRLRNHAGQIAFPGGKQDPEDPDPWHTAVREAEEELELPGEQLLRLGQLDDCWTPTGFRIRPFVAWNQGKPPRPAGNGEVELAFQLPIAPLLEVDCALPWPRYPSPHGQIWGATGRILHQWLSLLRGEDRST